MKRAFQAGEPVWVELSTNEPQLAELFYSRLLGWQIRHEDLAGGVYRMCTLAGRDVGGISESPHMHGGRPRGWITYFAVDDVAAAVARAVDLGGEVLMPPLYLPAAGTGATLTDPFGAVFGLYQGERRAGVETLNVAGALCWNELDTGEPQRSVEYYQALFGFGTEHQDSPTERPYTVLTLGDMPVAGVLAMDNDWPNLLPSRWIAYFNVPDLDAALETVTALGGSPTVGPVTTAHGALHLVRDPDGNSVCLIQLQSQLRRGNAADDASPEVAP